jgi:hypothetical protein
MATLPEVYTTEEQSYVVRFCGQNDSLKRIIIKKYFLYTVGSVCRVKWFTTGSRNSLKEVRKTQMMSDQVQKWLRQQSKDFYAVGFDALVELWGKCINVGREYVEKYFSRFEYHMFCVLYPFVTCLLTLLCINKSGSCARTGVHYFSIALFAASLIICHSS